jgi:hypothetical protein
MIWCTDVYGVLAIPQLQVMRNAIRCSAISEIRLIEGRITFSGCRTDDGTFCDRETYVVHTVSSHELSEDLHGLSHCKC